MLPISMYPLIGTSQYLCLITVATISCISKACFDKLQLKPKLEKNTNVEHKQC